MDRAPLAEPFGLGEDEAAPRYLRLSRLLGEYIRRSDLAEGAELPSEKEIMERSGLSRTTVRQAVQVLEGQGLVRKVQGKGTFVARPGFRSQVQAMTTIEASLAAQGHRVTNRLLEFGQADAPEWGRGLGLDEAGPLRFIRRLKLVDDSPWALESRFIPVPVADRFSRAELAEESIFELFKRHDDIRVCRVAYTITGAALDPGEAEELMVRPGADALFRTASYHNRTETLIMLGRVVFLAERTALRYEFRREDRNWGIVEVV